MKRLLQLTLLVSIILSTACGEQIPSWLQGALEIIIPTVATIFAGILTVLGAKLTSFIASKAKSEQAAHAINVIGEFSSETAQAIVLEYKNLVLDSLKDGKIDEEERKRLQTLGFKIVKERLDAPTLKKFASSLGITQDSVDAYISEKVSNMLGLHFGLETSRAMRNVQARPFSELVAGEVISTPPKVRKTKTSSKIKKPRRK